MKRRLDIVLAIVIIFEVIYFTSWNIDMFDTEDKLKNHNWFKRRTRILLLQELVYIALINYPSYFSLKYNCYTEIENIIEELEFHKNIKLNPEQLIFRYWGIIKDYLIKKNV